MWCAPTKNQYQYQKRKRNRLNIKHKNKNNINIINKIMITIKNKQTNTNFDNIPTNASKCMPREIFKIKRLHPKDKKTYKDTHTNKNTW